MNPTEWLDGLQGTEAGSRVAFALALVSAVAHAGFGALQKGRHDPWSSRGAIDAAYALMALPVALFVLPWPEPGLWPILAGAFVIHTCYKLLQAMAYDRGAYTAVYPVVRGTSPVATTLFAGIVFGEVYAPGQWAGLFVLSGGIFLLAATNIVRATADRRTLSQALALAFATGLLTAVYTTYDAWGIRVAANPFTFLAWFFVIDGLVFPALAAARRRRMADPAPIRPLILRGILGALIAYLSFGSVMLATRIDKVGEAAALRETSVVFAALIGRVFLGETVGWTRTALMALIALGAVMVEFG